MTALRKPEPLPERTVLAVPSMHCAGCMSKIERGLGAEPGIVSARVNLSARTVTVEHDPSLDAHDLADALDVGMDEIVTVFGRSLPRSYR